MAMPTSLARDISTQRIGASKGVANSAVNVPMTGPRGVQE